ncbi:chromosome segregation protein ScpA [Helicobacter bilis]|uniref:Beta-lactamase n=1 Tax=Helicobacter bilis TaxID=37372 RepID=A0A1Q2LIM0_9HELI|nr:tetratricopeptide repeat protein [Helicobacter bilis]AQQ59857.1 chromosome segregation protein ScpA [Helicobacter bilis]
MRFVFFVMATFSVCFANILDSIRTEHPKNFSKETWEVHTQQCLNKNAESCKIVIEIGLKTLDECKAKNECSVIGEIFLYADSIKRAMSYFEKACDKKDMNGCYFIGLYKAQNNNFVEAMPYFEKACDKKHAPSCFMNANFYEHGKGVRQDYEKAATLYKKSCKLKYPNACFTLGNLHEAGKALAHNLSLAKEFYGKACDMGMQKGCDSYKELNQSGIPSLYQDKNVFD